MGEVRRVWDRVLERHLALKLIKADFADHPELLARFSDEARLTARLQHPGIVPIHDYGEVGDGRLFFTMREVQGRNFKAVIGDLHAASADRWGRTEDGWTLRRLVEAFARACEAVGHAHALGVVHRDLKPENLMVGAHGEVLVVDWGLAKRVGGVDAALEDIELSEDLTQVGNVMGTPRWMAPEQARGAPLSPAADVYALGGVLFLLLLGRVPWAGFQRDQLMDELTAGRAPEFFAMKGKPAVDPVLSEICQRSMAHDLVTRFPDAEALGDALRAWLDGVRQREIALHEVREAEALVPIIRALRDEAEGLRVEAEGRLEGVPTWAPASTKARAWAIQDLAGLKDREAELAELEIERRLAVALSHAPQLEEAHEVLVARRLQGLDRAEACRDEETARREAHLLRHHAVQLPPISPARRAALKHLDGVGRLKLTSSVPAEVELVRYVRIDRRLVASRDRMLGTTPLDVRLERGSWACVLRAPWRTEVTYPVFIERSATWTGHVEMPEELGAEEHFVPGGPFLAGGDDRAFLPLQLHTAHTEDLVARRFQVTLREYLDFLDDLVSKGQRERALELAPRAHRSIGGAPYTPLVGDRFQLVVDEEGDEWMPRWPAIGMNLEAVQAWIAWHSERTGLPWRLPTPLEWEKLARGVDGRHFPWGDAFDPAWCSMRLSAPNPVLTEVDAYPTDVSPYGIRGLAGGVRDWCAPEGDKVIVKGGTYSGDARNGRAASRLLIDCDTRYLNMGFRIVRSL